MGWLYHLNAGITHGLEGFLETAVPMIAGLAEVIGLFIIVTSLIKATYHYVRATFFHDHHDFHHEMSSGLTTALESGVGGAVGCYLCTARHDELDAALGNAGRTPLWPQKSGKRHRSGKE